MAANTLDDLFDVWDEETGGGRDVAAARAIADSYVAEHPTEFAELAEWTLEQCVAAVDTFRATAQTYRDSGMDAQAAEAEANKLKVDVWLLHHFEPQQIGGNAAPTVRIV